MPYGTSKIYAFLDESGSYGWNLENPSCGSHFIIAAIIVEEDNIKELKEKLTQIKKDFFSNSEMKSSSISNNTLLRKKILAKCFDLPCKIYLCIVDKQKMKDWPGMQFKESFYKNINGHLYNSLKNIYPKLVISADELISEEYTKSFIKYIKKNEDKDLFNECDFYFENSEDEIIIQLADLIAGSIRRTYDKTIDETFNFNKMLKSKILDTNFYPESWQNYINPNPEERKEFDEEISRICLDQAVKFLDVHKGPIPNLEERARVITLRFLLSQMVNNPDSYISTRDIRRHLESLKLDSYTTQSFRNKIIAKMRDEGVLITSSQHGYKIPTSEAELYSFIDHGNSIVVPMLSRLRKCRDIIYKKTLGRVDLFNRDEYKNLRNYMESQEE